MRKDRDVTLDSMQPSLTVTYGNTARKVRPLDRDVLILGRASVCDVNPVSPEVAQIHCVIVRVPDGWRVRDCGSRTGTRLNGKALQDSPLADGDVLQIGSFSFHLNLPGSSSGGSSGGRSMRRGGEPPANAPVDDGKWKKLQRSRRHLAELAIGLRKRCQAAQGQARAVQQAENLVEERHAELAKKREELREQHDELEGKAGEILQLERELNARFTALEHELGDFQDRQEQIEAEIIRRQSEADSRLRLIQQRETAVRESEASFAAAAAEVNVLRDEVERAQADLSRRQSAWEADRQELEQRRAEPVRTGVEAVAAAVDPASTQSLKGVREVIAVAKTEELDRRAEELSQFARHLREAQEQLAARESQLTEGRQQLSLKMAEVERIGAEQLAEREKCVTAEAAALESFDREELLQLEAREAELVAKLAAAEREREEARQLAESLRLRTEEMARRSTDDLVQRAEELLAREEKLVAERAAWQRGQDEAVEIHHRHREEMVRAQAELREQRVEVIRVMAELRQARREPAPEESAGAEAIAAENEELRKQLATHQSHLQAITDAADREIAEARATTEHLRGEADELARHLECALDEAASLAKQLDAVQKAEKPATAVSSAEDANARLVALTAEIDARDAKLRKLEEELKGFRAGIENSGGYEMELHRFRLEVERDRKTLETDRAQMLEQNQEMEHELRQAELHMARERAQMARDRAEMQRLREDISLERERIERAAPMRDKLAPLHRLKADLLDRKSSETPAPGGTPHRRNSIGSDQPV